MKDLIEFLRDKYFESCSQPGHHTCAPEWSLYEFVAFARKYLQDHPIVGQGYADEGLTVTFNNGDVVRLTPARALRDTTPDIPITRSREPQGMRQMNVDNFSIPIGKGRP